MFGNFFKHKNHKQLEHLLFVFLTVAGAKDEVVEGLTFKGCDEKLVFAAWICLSKKNKQIPLMAWYWLAAKAKKTK